MRRDVQLGHRPRRLPTERDDDLIDVPRETAAVRIGVAQLGEQGLRVARDQLVQHRPLGGAPLVAAERLSGSAGRAFVESTREHVCVR
jgi:hypothetical protein